MTNIGTMTETMSIEMPSAEIVPNVQSAPSPAGRIESAERRRSPMLA